MRVSLLVGSTLYPLAGQAGVSERTHSSAADFQITANANAEPIQRLRAAAILTADRGNLATEISFTTSRQFDQAPQAFAWALNHDLTIPRKGILIFETVGVRGGLSEHRLLEAIVSPPSRKCIGRTVLLEYRVLGSKIIQITAPPLEYPLPPPPANGYTDPYGQGYYDLTDSYYTN